MPIRCFAIFSKYFTDHLFTFTIPLCPFILLHYVCLVHRFVRVKSTLNCSKKYIKNVSSQKRQRNIFELLQKYSGSLNALTFSAFVNFSGNCLIAGRVWNLARFSWEPNTVTVCWLKQPDESVDDGLFALASKPKIA